MASITLESGVLSSFFLVPRAVESHLPTATHAQLKVLMGLFLYSGQTMEEKVLADKLSIKTEELADAIKYWTSAGMLVKRGGILRLAVITGTAEDEIPRYSPETIAVRAEKDKALSELLLSAENILGKLLSPSDVSSLFGIYDWLGLPADVIMMLLEYCRQNKSTGMRYIEKCALSWADEGIDTFEKAEYKLRILENRRQAESRIISLFGIGSRALTKKEASYISDWVNDMQMSFELIEEAYEEAVNSTGKLSFPYINKVLKSWKEKGVKTTDNVPDLPRPQNKNRKKSYDKKESAYDDADFLTPTWELLD